MLLKWGCSDFSKNAFPPKERNCIFARNILPTFVRNFYYISDKNPEQTSSNLLIIKTQLLYFQNQPKTFISLENFLRRTNNTTI